MIKKALGRGLSSLIPDSYVSQTTTPAREEKKSNEAGSGFELIPISEIGPNPDQPREIFSAEGIEELAKSIQEKGILQPVIVKKRQSKDGPTYELICGERRLKAALLSGLEKVPAVVKEVAQDDLLEWALIENIQREDLNPLEEARAFERLVAERGLSQEEVAKRVGKNRTTITNAIRLLRLPSEVTHYVREGKLSAGHARALLALFTEDHQVQLARKIVKENLSVRQVEEMVARSVRKRRARAARHLTAEVADLEIRLSQHLGTPVKVITSKGGRQGRIVIQYFSLDELDRVLSLVHLPPL